ncbi:hypothetical protein [Pimelobacter simplex]
MGGIAPQWPAESTLGDTGRDVNAPGGRVPEIRTGVRRPGPDDTTTA